MKKNIYFYNLFCLFFSFLIIILNFLIQKIVLKKIKFYGDNISLFNHFNLIFVKNFGIAFGFLSDQTVWKRWFFIFFGLIICFILIIFSVYKKDIGVAYFFIIGGGLGNVLDRIRYGFVIDFIDFYIGKWHWPTFNINDVGIFIGMLILFLEDFKILKKIKKFFVF